MKKLRQILSDKFQDFEAVPQDDSWEKIRFDLDLKEKLGNYEAEPQAESWEQIKLATILSEKFRQFEAEPQDQSWEKIQLATNLSEKFRQFEAEPQDESWTKIKAAIQKEERRPIVFIPFYARVGIAASIALLLGFGWLLNRNNQADLGNVLAIKNPQKIAGGVPHNQSVIGKKTNEISKEKLPENISSQKNLTKNNLAEKRKPAPISNQVSNKNNNFEESKKTDFVQNKVKTIPEKEKNNIQISLKNNEKNFIADNQKIDIPQTPSNDKTLTFNLLSSKSFKARVIRKPFEEIAYNNTRPIFEKEERVRRRMILTTSLMPLQAYQALTILPQTNSYIQQVGTLNALDAQRLGVQFRIGAMQPLSNRFSTGASFTYSGIQQRVSYDVNNGDFEIQTTDSQTYSLVALSENVSQNKFLQTVGLKIDNSFLLSKRKNEVYILGGGEAVKVINDKQYAYYLNVSVGVSYPTKGGKSIWIEPTFRYSLSQSLDANSYLQIRPYNIGLNVRVNFM